MKTFIATVLASTMLATTALAVDYDSMIDREEALAIQKAAHTMATAARELGYSENSYIIAEAQEHWWEAQEIIEWCDIPVSERVWDFLINEMGLSEAAACGIMANIEAESNFDYKVDISWGYGLVAWCGGRREAAKETEAEYGNRLVGQLRHIEKELTGAYSHVLEKMNAVSNDATGAYKAGRIFCLEYEIPVNMYPKANYRGALARDFYWPLYATEES